MNRFIGYCHLIIVFLITSPLLAGPYSDLIVFGDSLSDVGNISQATFGSQPGSYYFNDRFSNGPVYSELLAAGLDLGVLTHSLNGGSNYAYGGAQTTGTGGIVGLFIDDVDEQVADYLSAGPADSGALYVVLAGANDLLAGQTDVSVPVNSLIDDLESLVAANAQNFLVLNLPMLGATPRFNGDPVQAAMKNALTMDYNVALSSSLDTLETSHPNMNLFRFDLSSLIDDAISDPGMFGLTNVTDSAAPGLTPGTAIYDTDLIVSNPDEYLFWDDIHPTTAAHAILAEHALAAATFAADFDFDGDVDSNDLTDPSLGWEARFGDDLTGFDFLAWQRQLGRSTAPPLAIQVVPEPTTALLFSGITLCTVITQAHRSWRPQIVG